MKNSGYGLRVGGKDGWMVCNACTCSLEIVHRKVGGIFIPHCNALSSLAYKRREGSLVEGLPILRVKGIPLRSRVITSRVLPCLCFLSSSSCVVWAPQL